MSIDDAAVTFGLGFPMTGSFSNINVGMEHGRTAKAAGFSSRKLH
jgi:hypothetical protein